MDDDSTGRTAEIVQSFAEEHNWIRLIPKPDRGLRSVGPDAVEASYFGYNLLQSRDSTIFTSWMATWSLAPITLPS